MATRLAPNDATPEAGPSPGPPRRGGFGGGVGGAWVAGVARVAPALAPPAARGLSRYSWFADLASHFQEPALAATLFAVAVTARRRQRLAAGLVILAAFQVLPLVRYAGRNPVGPDPRSPDRLRVLLANVRYDNTNFD